MAAPEGPALLPRHPATSLGTRPQNPKKPSTN